MTTALGPRPCASCLLLHADINRAFKYLAKGTLPLKWASLEAEARQRIADVRGQSAEIKKAARKSYLDVMYRAGKGICGESFVFKSS